MAPDGSMVEEKAGLEPFAPSLGFSFTLPLPTRTPISDSDLLAIVLALREVPSWCPKVLLLPDAL